MTMKAAMPVLFTDLDDTLFQTARKMREPICQTRLASIAKNGHHSYMTASQARLLQWLLENMHVIPVTARSTEALARVRIPFASWRIAANGAVILRSEGDIDRQWQSQVAKICKGAAAELDALLAAVRKGSRADALRSWIVEEDGLPIYLCVKSNGDEAWLDEVEAELRSLSTGRFTPHRNGNNLSFTPHGISKQQAVLHLDERISESVPRLGMGDSLTDLPFMGLCDMMMIPPSSQIATAFEKA